MTAATVPLRACEQRAALDSGALSARELALHCLEEMERLDAGLGSYLAITREQALAQADGADRRLRDGERGGMLGLPVAYKDVLSTRGVETTAGSRILAGYLPPYDATAVARLRAAGGVMLGKTNCDEFAMGSSSESSAFKPVRNPWDPSRVPGGSSGGSAAAVAAGLATVTLGTDTGGSIRQPAALCGVVGVKPTYGRVSRYGQIAFASSLDQIGPFGREVEECCWALSAISGRDPRDSTSLDAPVPDYAAVLGRGVRGLRVGLPREYLAAGEAGSGIDAAVAGEVRAAVERLGSAGAEIVEVSLPHTRYAMPAYYLIAPAEASANLARFDGVRYGYRAQGATDVVEEYLATRREGFGAEVKRRIMLGTYSLSAGYYDAYYLRAQKARTLIIEDFAAAFQSCDVIASPTSPSVAFGLGAKADPLAMYLCDINTIPANLAGLPGVSVPCGLAPPPAGGEPLPVGLQLLGPALSEELLLAVAAQVERDRVAWGSPRIQAGLG